MTTTDEPDVIWTPSPFFWTGRSSFKPKWLIVRKKAKGVKRSFWFTKALQCDIMVSQKNIVPRRCYQHPSAWTNLLRRFVMDTLSSNTPQSNDFIEIPATKGCVALVSLVDQDLLQKKWHTDKDGYAIWGYQEKDSTKIKKVKMHRVILERMLGRPLEKGELCDHINGHKMDNRRENLRVVTPSQNIMNIRHKRNASSQYKGVTWRAEGKGRWEASIKVNNKSIHLGRFSLEEDAAKAYDEAAIKYFGEYARINFVKGVAS